MFPGCVHLIFTACGLARQSSLTGAYIIGCYRTCCDRLMSSLLRDCSCTTHPALERLRSEREASAVCTQMCACLVTCSGDHYRAVLPLHYLHSRYPPPKRWSASWLVPRPRPRSRSTAWVGGLSRLLEPLKRLCSLEESKEVSFAARWHQIMIRPDHHYSRFSHVGQNSAQR
jgi:hypothetical protein